MQEPDYAEIGMRIRQLRKKKGWTQDELAKKCGISLAFMGHIEHGTRKMSLDTFVSLCRELDADADELLAGTQGTSETVIQRAWNKLEKTDRDGYSMYIRMMKSVADIMGEV